ncbi:MAG: MerR family transcriptional regulator [Eubacteriales bacterium]|nr:MerR family transcriptional regulator [Eubacteriales bacterium]
MEFNRISVSEFAKLNGISRQTLLFYDKLDLFKPEYIAENGYRYYTWEQSDILTAIQALKTAGLSLDEIMSYLKNRDSESSLEIYSKQIKKITEDIIQLKQIKESLESRTKILKRVKDIDTNRIHIESIDAICANKSADIPDNATNTQRYQIRAEHYKFRMDRQLMCGAAPSAAVSVEKPELEDGTTNYKYYFTPLDEGDKDVNVIIPGGNFVVAYHCGPYYTSFKSYERIKRFAYEHKFILGEYGYEVSIVDEVTEADPEKWITQIAVPFSLD